MGHFFLGTWPQNSKKNRVDDQAQTPLRILAKFLAESELDKYFLGSCASVLKRYKGGRLATAANIRLKPFVIVAVARPSLVTEEESVGHAGLYQCLKKNQNAPINRPSGHPPVELEHLRWQRLA